MTRLVRRAAPFHRQRWEQIAFPQIADIGLEDHAAGSGRAGLAPVEGRMIDEDPALHCGSAPLRERIA